MVTIKRRTVWNVALGLLAGLIVLVVIGVGSLWLWFDHAGGEPPQLSEGALQGFATGDETWTRRLAETFPVGTSETILTARLRQEGFEVAAASRSARYEWGSGFPCLYMLTASWSAESGRVTAISGRYSNACM